MDDLYYYGETPYHRLHPSAKIIFLIFYSLCALIIQHPLYNFIFFVLSILLLVIGRFSLAHLMRFAVLLPILIMPAVIWPFWLEGNVLLAIPLGFGRLTITDFGLTFGFTMVMRFASFLPPVIIFLSTTRQREIINGLHQLRMPFKFSLSLTLILRYIPVSKLDFSHANAAQYCRRESEGKGKYQLIKDKILLIVPVFFSMLQRASTLSDILEMRGITATKDRTFYKAEKPAMKDYLFMLGVLVLFAVCLALRISGRAHILPGIL